MAHPPRYLRPDTIYFLTSRTIDGALWLRPSRAVNNAIGAILADAQRRYGVELFDFVFLSNHMHLAARSRSGLLPPFVQYVKANIAVEVNRLLDRRGHLWERRYAASPILDEGAEAERASHVYAHGVKEGLVARAAAWPGVASVKERLSGRSELYERVDRTALSRATHNRAEPPDPADFTRKVRIALTPWPFLAGRTLLGQRRQVVDLVADAERQARFARRGRPVLGARAVVAQEPWTGPRSELARTPNPLCHATSAATRAAYREGYSQFVAAYRESSRRFRSGDLRTRFPSFSYPPPLPLDWARTQARGEAPTRAGPPTPGGA